MWLEYICLNVFGISLDRGVCDSPQVGLIKKKKKTNKQLLLMWFIGQ
jgi:hypothetical protein